MRRLGRAVLWLLALLVLTVAATLVFGPREPVDRVISFDAAALPEDPAALDAWLAEAEAPVPAIRPGSERRILWAGTPGAVTETSLVYLHGFSASSEEIRPVPDRVAGALGANLYFARLRGHGRDGPAMAEARAGDWIEDMAEALEIGRRIGRRVVVIGTSTGGTLAALIPQEPALRDGVAGIVFVSPNFAVNRAGAGILTLPLARTWLPRLLGAERGFEPVNDAHRRHWTSRYPTVATVPMAALVREVRGLDPAESRLPALFLYSEHDGVVSPSATRAVHDAWGGPKRIETRVMGPGDDPASHIIAGHILSPGQTDATVELILDWIAGL